LHLYYFPAFVFLFPLLYLLMMTITATNTYDDRLVSNRTDDIYGMESRSACDDDDDDDEAENLG
jgi:hypothetical protein